MDVNDTLIEAINILIKSALEKAEFDKQNGKTTINRSDLQF